MQCANCDREILQKGSQFCPFCATPLHLVDSPKKKKNNAVHTRTLTDWNRGGWISSFVLIGMAFVFVLSLIAFPDATLIVLSIGIVFAGVVGWFYSSQCEGCGHFFTMQRTKHERLSSKKFYQMLRDKHPRQIVVLRINWQDQYRCSVCGHEKQRTYTKDYDSFSE